MTMPNALGPKRPLDTDDLSKDDLTVLRQMIDQYRHPTQMYETPTPTAELLEEAARLIHNLMSGRGVDCRNGFQWEPFVRELRDRAAEFKACNEVTPNDGALMNESSTTPVDVAIDDVVTLFAQCLELLVWPHRWWLRRVL